MHRVILMRLTFIHFNVLYAPVASPGHLLVAPLLQKIHLCLLPRKSSSLLKMHFSNWDIIQGGMLRSIAGSQAGGWRSQGSANREMRAAPSLLLHNKLQLVYFHLVVTLSTTTAHYFQWLLLGDGALSLFELWDILLKWIRAHFTASQIKLAAC